MVTPISPTVLLTGKCLPFIVFGLIDVCGILLLGSLLFDVPMRGSLAVVGLGAFLYLFSTLGIGSFIAPSASMPSWLQPITWVIPMRHFIEILRGCLLKGATLADLAPQLTALTILGALLLTVSVVLFRRNVA